MGIIFYLRALRPSDALCARTFYFLTPKRLELARTFGPLSHRTLHKPHTASVYHQTKKKRTRYPVDNDTEEGNKGDHSALVNNRWRFT
jgi:hypothetical protein